MVFDLKEGEELLTDVAANLFRGIEAVGGRMKITNRRVLFEAHAINLQKMPAEISLEQIADVRKRNTLGIIPNGILIRTKTGVEYKFVVWNREQLINLILSQKESKAMKCPKCGRVKPESTLKCVCGYEFSAPETKAPSTDNVAPIEKEVKGAMFKNSDYMPFMLGIFIVGGLLVIPLTWGLGVGLGYFAALPWSLASCVVFLIAFRRNGTISWGRAIPAIAAIVIAAQVYSVSTSKPAFAAGGILGFFAIMICGYIGIGIGRFLRRRQR